MKAPRFTCTLLIVLASALPLSAADVVGVITGVDLDKKEVLIEGRGRARGKTLTLVLDADTQILFGKRAATAADLASGRRVNVEYEDRDGKQVARVLHVHGPKPTVAVVPADKGALTGIVRRVALTDREIVVIGPGAKGKETETTVAVPEAARILKDGKAVALESLKEEDLVSVVAENARRPADRAEHPDRPRRRRAFFRGPEGPSRPEAHRRRAATDGEAGAVRAI